MRKILCIGFGWATFIIAGCSSAPKPQETPTPVSTAAAEPSAFQADIAAFAVYDTSTKKVIVEENADQPVVPASSIKVLTMYAAYKILGDDFAFRTELLARGLVNDGVLDGDLILRGAGDPSLSSADLLDLAYQIRRAGIREVRGALYYDDRVFVPVVRISEDVAPDEPYNSPISGLDVDFNQVADGDQRRPMAEPAATAARRFAQFARAIGLRVPEPGRGKARDSDRVLHRHSSLPIAQLVRSTLEFSNNLMAESLCMAAAHKLSGKPVTMREGARAAAEYLASRFKEALPEGKWNLENCSGLGIGTRVTAKEYTAVLAGILDDQEMPVYFGSLLKFSGADYTALVKPGGMDYLASLGGVIITPSAPARIFFIHYGNPALRESTRAKPKGARKAGAQEWAHYFRAEIRRKLGPFWGVENE